MEKCTRFELNVGDKVVVTNSEGKECTLAVAERGLDRYWLSDGCAYHMDGRIDTATSPLLTGDTTRIVRKYM